MTATELAAIATKQVLKAHLNLLDARSGARFDSPLASRFGSRFGVTFWLTFGLTSGVAVWPTSGAAVWLVPC